MKIQVEVDDNKIRDLVITRIYELFGDDQRFRDTGVRDLIRRVVDDAAVSAVRLARDAIAGELPAMAQEAVRRAIKEDMDKAAKRGLAMLHK